MLPTLILAVVHPAMPIEHPPVKIDPPAKEVIQSREPVRWVQPAPVSWPVTYSMPGSSCGPGGCGPFR